MPNPLLTIPLAIVAVVVIYYFFRRRRIRHKMPKSLQRKLFKHTISGEKLPKPIVEKFFLSTGIAPGEGKHLTRARMFYTSNVDKMDLFASFVWEGLFGGERVIYIYPDEEDYIVRAKLRQYGIDVGKHLEEGSLLLIPVSKAYLSNGIFNIDKALRFWSELKADTMKNGYKYERHLIDLGDLGFIKGQEEKYFRFLREEARMQLLDPYIIELRAINRENLSQRLINEFKMYTARFVDLFKRANVFSKALGLSHSDLIGRKILFEFDPASRYEKTIQNFVTEALTNVEQVTVFTRRGSALHASLSQQKTIKFFCLTQQVSVPRELSENEILLPSNDISLMLDVMDKTLKANPHDIINVIFDNLSDLVLSIGFEKTYHFTKYATEILASSGVTALFLLNASAHDSEVVHSLRSLFDNQICFGKEGIQTVKLPKAEAETKKAEKLAVKR
jgi:hypothetical protein